MTKILLGKLKSDADIYASGENIYLRKHTFDCGWYWGFGYVGNYRCHHHFETFLKDAKTASELFESQIFLIKTGGSFVIYLHKHMRSRKLQKFINMVVIKHR